MLRLVKWVLMLSLLLAIGGSCIVAALAMEAALHPIHFRRASDTAALAFSTAHAVNGTAIQVSIRTQDGVTLKSWYLTPGHPNGSAIIACHGVADSGYGVMGDAMLFLRNGYTVLAPDSRGHGDSGGFVTYGVLEAHDVVLWQRWLAGQHAGPIFGFGESLGGAELLLSLARGAKFNAVVAESSYGSFRRVARERVIKYGRVAPPIADLLLNEGLLYARVRYGVNLSDAKPEDAVRNVTIPILLIHGMDDRETYPAHSKEVAHNAKNAELWLVPKAGHTGAYALAPREFEERVPAFFASHAGK